MAADEDFDRNYRIPLLRQLGLNADAEAVSARLSQPGDGKILIRLPGTGVVVDYASQRERDQSVRLAQARQRIAERTGYIPSWDELSEEERELAILEARNWLRAAIECGLAGEDGGG